MCICILVCLSVEGTKNTLYIYSEVKIHYLKYFGMLPLSVNLLLFIKVFYFTTFNKNHFYNNY